jgi:hypothetical protein
LPAELTDRDHPPTPEQLVDFVRGIAANYFRGLVPSEAQDYQITAPFAAPRPGRDV